jgi:protein involved in polysaccharide export with SLBB domain
MSRPKKAEKIRICISMVLLLTAMIFLTFPVCFAAGEPYKAYRIGPEDVLEISVWKDESLTRQVVVRPDGMISFPLIGEVEAGGINAFADANSILVLRTEKSFQIRIPFRYKEVEKGENLEQNILLETGDVVVVP